LGSHRVHHGRDRRSVRDDLQVHGAGHDGCMVVGWQALQGRKLVDREVPMDLAQGVRAVCAGAAAVVEVHGADVQAVEEDPVVVTDHGDDDRGVDHVVHGAASGQMASRH